jgi:hypothetical protein
MNEPSPVTGVAAALVAMADRLEDLAETADLMGDVAGAQRFRDQASTRRLEAMARLDP